MSWPTEIALLGFIPAVKLWAVSEEQLVLLTEQNSAFDAIGTFSMSCFED